MGGMPLPPCPVGLQISFLLDVEHKNTRVRLKIWYTVKNIYLCSRHNWAWKIQLGLAVRMQDAGVSRAGVWPTDA